MKKSIINQLRKNPFNAYQILRDQNKKQSAPKNFPAETAKNFINTIDAQLLQLIQIKSATEQLDASFEITQYIEKIDLLSGRFDSLRQEVNTVIHESRSASALIRLQAKHRDHYNVQFDKIVAKAPNHEVFKAPANQNMPAVEVITPVVKSTKNDETKVDIITSVIESLKHDETKVDIIAPAAKPTNDDKSGANEKTNPLTTLLGDGSFGDKARKQSNSPEGKKLNSTSINTALKALQTGTDKLAALEDAYQKIISKDKGQSYNYVKRREPHGFLFFKLRNDGVHLTGTQQRHIKHLKAAYLDVLRDEAKNGNKNTFKQVAEQSTLLNANRSNYQAGLRDETDSYKSAISLVS